MQSHIPFYREIFALPGFMADPFMMIGYQDLSGDSLPPDFAFRDVKALLQSRGVKDITTVDLFDYRADRTYDLNGPVPLHELERYGTVMDIGTLEHMFDTRMVLENCLRLVRPGGLYFLHTCVNGYFRHGLHVFNPDMLVQTLTANDFEILFHKYSNSRGEPVADPSVRDDIIIWLVGKKKKPLDRFRGPQQESRKDYYLRKGGFFKRVARKTLNQVSFLFKPKKG